MRKDIFLPVLALAGGAVGFLLRLWQYASAYDPSTELFAHGAPASLALVVWAVLMGALALGHVPYDRWVKFVWKLILYFLALTMMLLIVGVIIG